MVITEAFYPVVLFGPPGVGKSTLIALAHQRGIESYDFEKGGNSYEERKKSMLATFGLLRTGFVLCGAADIQRKDFPMPVRSVLLLPDRQEYVRRMTERNNISPHKANQKNERVYDKFNARQKDFDLVINDIASPERLLDEILSEFTL